MTLSLRPLRAALLGAVALSTLCTPVAQAQTRAQAQIGLGSIRDTEIEEILHKECDPIFAAAGLDPKGTTVILIQGPINAMTLNSRIMAITTDLIKETANPNELIGVMAHETGHAAGGHAVRSGEMQKAGLAPFLLTLGLGVLAAAAGAPDAAAALLSSSSYFGALGALAYSREQEARADQAGLTYLEKAGESGRGLVEFMDNFRYQEVFDEARRYPYFQDHPIFSDRVESMRRRAESLSHYNEVDPPELVAEHEIMKAKILAFMDAPQQTFIKYKETDTSYVARYARAIAYYKSGEPDRAIKAIDGLLAEHPDNPYLWELKGQVLFENGQAKDAVEPHRKSVELKPDAPLLQINLAQALLGEEDKTKADEAIAHLQRALRSEGDNSIAWGLMAQAYDAKGQPGQARLAAAEAQYSIGDLAQARIFALRARQMLTRNSPEWRRATDIVLVAKPTEDDLKALQRENG